MRARRPSAKFEETVKKPAAKKRKDSSKSLSAKRRIRPIVRRLVASLAALAVLLAVGSITWAVKDGLFTKAGDAMVAAWHARLDELSVKFGLTLKEVEIDGHHYVSRETILEALAISPEHQYGMLTLSGEALSERLKSIEFIRSVSVEKHFPDKITLHIEERQPVAIWQHQGNLSLIDAEGVVLRENDVGQFWKLPVLVGRDAVFHAKGLLEFLVAEPELFSHVASMTQVSSRRWDIQMENGTLIRLPEDQPGAAWATLAKLEKEQQLLEKQIKIIDLRLPEKVYILPLPPALPGDDGKVLETPPAAKPEKAETTETEDNGKE